MLGSILRVFALFVLSFNLGSLSAADLLVPSQFGTIQEAIDASMDGDRILIAPGTYLESLTSHGRAIEIASAGGLVTINGGGQTTISASVQHNETLTLNGLTITNQLPPSGEEPMGGGLLFGGGSLALLNCVVTGNATGGFITSGTGHVVENCTISDNNSHGLKFIGSIGTVVVRDSLFTGNFSISGGAGLSIESTAGPQAGIVTVEGCEFTDNEAFLYGAGAYLSRLEQTEVTQCLFTHNLSPLGGALTVGPNDLFHASSCRLFGNEAGQGGGVLMDLGSSSNQATFDRCLFVDNEVTLNGGAISASINGGNVFLNRCTIANNVAPVAGAVSANGHTLVVENSIAWANGTGEVFNAGTGSVSVNYSDIEGGWPGVGNIDLDPQFTDPASGFQYSLLPGSPCIDAGDPAHPLDLDGSIVDMGAIPFETVTSSSPLSMAPIFLRGDSNGDGVVDVADPVKLLGHLFFGGTLRCADRSDANDDGQLDVADPVRVLSYLFASGEPPAPPFPNCWWDGTVDGLGCEDLPACE